MSSSAIEQNASFSSTILMLLVVVWFDKNWPRHSKYRDCLLIDWIRQSEERKKNTEIFSKIHLIDLYKVHGQVHRIYTWSSSSPSSSRIASHHDNEIIGSYLMMMMMMVRSWTFVHALCVCEQNSGVQKRNESEIGIFSAIM